MSHQDFKFSLHLKSNPNDESKGEIHVDCGGYISEQSLVELFQYALETFKALFGKPIIGEVGFAMVLTDFVRIENQKPPRSSRPHSKTSPKRLRPTKAPSNRDSS